MDKQEEVLRLIPEALRTDLIKSLQSHNRVASGKTIDALEAVASGDHAQLLAPEHITALESGRKPTRQGAPKSDPPLIEIIKEWCASRGIDEGAAYAITKKIHEVGFEGTVGVLSEPLSDSNVNLRVDQAVGMLANILTTQLGNLLNI